MKPHSGSILLKLQLGFGLAAMVLAALLALFMDGALRGSLEAEDAQVMEGQARALTQRLAAGLPLLDPGGHPRPEKAAWRVRDASGRILAESGDMAALPALEAPPLGAPVLEQQAPGGGVYSVVARAWSGGGQAGTLVLVMDRTHEEALIHDFRRTLALGVVLATAAAALVARAIARWGLAPLGRIAREAGSISDRNLDRRLATEHFPRELQELVTTLNATLSRLQEAFDRVGNLGAELAHELRTPLQNLRSTLENRALRPDCPEPEAAALGGLLEECDRMAALIEQILFLARSEHAPPELRRVRVPVADLLEEVRGFFEAAAEHAGVALCLEGGAGLAVSGDRLLLTRALHNLVANALRHASLHHASRGGRVTLGAQAAPEAVGLFVADDGPGIPEAWIPRLGTPFLRPPDGRPLEGYGLGLAIVKRIAGMLGGRMEIQSRLGEGTRVELWIPRDLTR
ncbi:hypothetical protein GETHOR_20470 [Geothrix oryzae]|uniref:histidine kinase n=1 Tax=Geothrix oryzae TaxID=2927975 RepID=A0ABM8DSC0_9BACT|nr:ATP-binding protein [Geothrix oryzae]BDU69946.1 hypothetical protein GETHOR_20470 [Geothrix oryzae]